MRKITKIILAGAGIMLVAGAAQGHRGGWRDGGGYHGFGKGRFGTREVTKDQAEERARARFARFDYNSDGVIDAGEIERHLSARMRGWFRRRGGRRLARRWQRRLARMDTNGDKKIDKAEFDQAMKKSFARIDLNNDGRITDDDLPPVLRDRGLLGAKGEESAMMMHGQKHRFGGWRKGRKMHRFMRLRGVDTNGDGAISEAEFLSAAAKRFQRWDKTGDGVLDMADRDARNRERSEYRIKRFIHRFGKQADEAGKVTRDQFVALAMERFSRRDLNNDGKISGEELPRRGGWWSRHGRFGGGRWHGYGR